MPGETSNEIAFYMQMLQQLMRLEEALLSVSCADYIFPAHSTGTQNRFVLEVISKPSHETSHLEWKEHNTLRVFRKAQMKMPWKMHTIKIWPSKSLSPHPSFLCGRVSNLTGLSQWLPVNTCLRVHCIRYNQGWLDVCRQLCGCLNVCSWIECLIRNTFFLSRWAVRYLKRKTKSFSPEVSISSGPL